MAIDSSDIVSTLQALGMMKYWKGKHIILKKQVRYYVIKAMWTSKSTQFHYLIHKHSNVYLQKQFFQALRVCKYYAQFFLCDSISISMRYALFKTGKIRSIQIPTYRHCGFYLIK